MKKISSPQTPEDEQAVRAFAAPRNGSIEVTDKYIELTFPEEISHKHIKGKNFISSSWHNLRAVAMGEGEVEG